MFRLRYHIQSNIFKNLFWLSFGEGFGIILFYSANVYLARILGSEAFGKLSFAFAFIPVTAIIADMGLSMYGMREMAKRNADFNSIIINILPVRFISSIVIFFASSIFIYMLTPAYDMRILLSLSFLYLIPYSLGLDWAYRGIEKMQYSALWTFSQNAIFFLLVIMMVKSKEDMLTAPLLRVAGVFAGSAALLYSAFRGNIKKISFPHSWKNTIIVSSPFMFSTLTAVILLNFDSVWLGIVDTPHSVGIYSAAYRVFFLLFGVMFAVQLAYAPNFAKIHPSTARSEIRAFSRVVHMISFPVVFLLMIFSEKIISIAYGAAYIESTGVLSILSVALLFNYLSGIYMVPFLFSGNERAYLISITISASVNVMANIILIPVFSYTGAAMAALISHALLYILSFAFFSKLFSLNSRETFAELFSTWGIALVFGICYYIITK